LNECVAPRAADSLGSSASLTVIRRVHIGKELTQLADGVLLSPMTVSELAPEHSRSPVELHSLLVLVSGADLAHKYGQATVQFGHAEVALNALLN
jgi:hypothetical protein